MKDKILKKGMHSIGAKIVALALTFMLVVTMMPASAFVSTASAATAVDKVSDYSTINEWQDYFLNGDTEYAGGVWTDKSVFKSGSDFDNALSSGETKTNIVTDENNFLVSMSALATNKEIVGYSTIPTDTIFVIDVSQSMDNSESIPQTVNAANSAIKKLLELNKNNRVGVVLYSGIESGSGSASTATAKLILGLDRYTPGNGGRYITYSGNNSKDTTVKTETGLKYEKNGKPGDTVTSISKQTIGGTYIQNGLDYAMGEFLNANPIVEENNIQEGETRMPVFVLLSDGAPTHATTSYTDIAASNMGTGISSTATSGTGFATQLTAAYARARVEAHYGRDARFYTLGLNLSETTGHAVATSVLDPEKSYNAINIYWDELFNSGSTNVTAHATNGIEYENFKISRPFRNENGKRVYTDLLTRDSQYYVDEYFEATNNEKLEAAFNNIVAQIILQSAYYPTHIEGSERDLSGYVTFSDKIGHYMEVKGMKGILLGDSLFTGETLAKMMKEGKFGNAGTYTDKGWELVETVSERIGVSEAEAINLLNSAWRDKQLYYDDENHYGNYIGWYEGEDSEYIAFWSQNDDDADVQTAVSRGAKYITKSYGYYGSTAEAGSILGSDMMHVVVKLRTEIATGLQEVIFEIPASLIPIITYAVTLNTDSYDTADKITMEIGDETPIRLLFEVGMTPDINEINLTEIMTAEGAHKHPVLDAQGNPTGDYYFYTNVWGNTNDPGGLDPSKHEVAESVFTPSTVNERYYYTEDSVIYVKSGDDYNKYRGAEAPAGDNYYRAYRVFELTGASGAAKLGYVYESIASETLTYNNGENIGRNDDGEWYIKKGAVRRTLPSYHIEKINDGNGTGGPTETLRYSRYAQILEDEDVEDYKVYSFQGNNGRLKMSSATGIKLTKLADETITDADMRYAFNVKLNNGENAEYTLVKNGVETKIKFTDGKSEDIVLKAGETVYITGLPAGTEYVITEQENEEYKVAEIKVNGIAAEEASGTLTDKGLQDVVFTNTERSEGNLVITKVVTHSLGSDYVIPLDKTFEGKVTLKDADGNALANTALNTSAGKITTTANGTINFELAHDESLTIYGLNEGTAYIVDETVIPPGFQLSAESETAGTVAADETAEATLVNVYTPNSPELGLTVHVDKVLTGLEDDEWGSRTFEFKLEQQSSDGWKVIDADSVDEFSKSVDLKIAADIFTSVGNYLFRIVENGEYPGIVNDTNKYITVVVTDNDMDGSLEINQVIRMNESVDFEGNKIEITFNNNYVVDGEVAVQIPITKELTNDTGVLLRPGGFVFGLFESNNGGESYDIKVDEAISNAAGEASINMIYDEKDLDGENEVTFEYELREIAGDMEGVTYSETAYNVTVTIGVNADDDLALIDWAITEKDGTEVTEAEFVNEYTVEPVTFSFGGKKVLDGRGIKVGDDFEFKLYKADADFAVSGEAVDTTIADQDGGSFGLGDIIEKAGTYYYVVQETAGDVPGVIYDTTKYHVTVVVDVDPDDSGKLKVISQTYNVVGGTVVEDVIFTNEYKTTPVSVAIKGTKTLTAKDAEGNILKSGQNIANGDFTFVLLEADEVTPVKDAKGNDIVAVSGMAIAEDGIAETVFTFPEIEYNAAGEYKYVIAERNDGKSGYTYDKTKHKVTVNVIDNGEGALVADVSETAADIEFENVYTPEPTSVVFKATKQMDGRPLENGEFDFGIYAVGSDFSTTGKEPLQIVSNNAAGTVYFAPISIEERGTFYYVMKEIVHEDADPNVVYDPAEYQITVIAWDTDGKLYTRVSSEIGGSTSNMLFFSNVYVEPAPVSVNLTGYKILKGRDLDRGEFGFELYETDSDFDLEDAVVLQDVNNGDNPTGKVDNIEFTSLTYDIDDLEGANSKSFYYVIKEVVPEDTEGVTYDNSVFNVTVTVTHDEDGELDAAIDIDDTATEDVAGGEAIVFKNEYDAVPAELVLGGTKTLDGKNLAEGEFDFALYETDSDYEIDGSEPIETVKNDEDKNYVFEKLTYTEPGEFYYAVVEVAGNNDKVTYDDTKHTVKVVVSDNGNGELEMDIENGDKQWFDKEAFELTDLNFTNGYDPEDTVVNLSGVKNLLNKDLTEGAFEFALYETEDDYDAEGKTPEQTTANDKDGAFNFDSLIFEEAGTYYYVVKESVPEETKGVTYDDTEYRIKVKVTYDADAGELAQIVTINGNEYNDATVTFGALNFENTYTSVLEDGAGLVIKGDKKLTGDRTEVEFEEFTFVLYEVAELNGNEVVTKLQTAKNGLSGEFAFDEINTYTEPGTHHYRVVEDAAAVEGMTYDNAVFDVYAYVSDNGEGNLEVTYEIVKDGAEVTGIEFVNTYETPVPKLPDVVIEKFQAVNGGEYTKDKLTVEGGDEVTYKVVVQNNGNGAAENAVVTDVIPEGLTLVEGSITADGTLGADGKTITWNLGVLEPGDTATLNFAATVPDVEKDTEWKNIAAVEYTEPGDGSESGEEPEPIEKLSNEVVIVEKPIVPMDETSDGGTQTGDGFNTGLYAFLALAALAVAGAAVRRRKAE